MYHIQTRPRKNSRKYSKTLASFETEQEVLDYCDKNNLKVVGYPYFFTHIDLTNDCIATASVKMANGDDIICSPEKLREAFEGRVK